MTTILRSNHPIKFDAANTNHRKAYVDFLNNGKWNTRFEVELPFTNVPSMAMFKLSVAACAGEGTVDQKSIFAKLI